MDRDSKKQLIAIFIVVMFVGSGIAFAVISALVPADQTVAFATDKPLSNYEEAYYLQQNMVVMRYYYSQDCIDCAAVDPIVETLMSHFEGNIYLERIDVVQYANETEGFTPPTIYLKGKTMKEITENFDVNSMFLDICELFFSPVEKCAM